MGVDLQGSRAWLARAPRVGLLSLLALACGCRAAAIPRPSIIFLLVDTLRADHLGFNGYPGPISPNLDRLAARSIVFDRCFAQSPWTKPSIATLFASLYPQVHGLTNHEGNYWGEGSPARTTGVLAPEIVTLAESLSQAGYRTAALITNPWVVGAYGFDQGFDYYNEAYVGVQSAADRVTEDARTWLEAQPDDEPYFLYLHFMDVHAPYNAPRSDHDALGSLGDLLRSRRLRDDQRPDLLWNNIEVPADWATDEMRQRLGYWQQRYAAGVRAFDRRIAGFLDYLQRTGRLDRSWLVLVSDHGEELFEHGGWSHGQTLFDDQLHVPLLVHPPGGVTGRRVQPAVELTDLMPTLLALARAEAPPALQGRDLSPLLRTAPAEPPDARPVLATATQRHPTLYALRTERYKLICDLATGGAWLFDLERDPGEHHDLAAAEPELADRLRGTLKQRVAASLAGGALRPDTAPLPEAVEQRLRALGYLD